MAEQQQDVDTLKRRGRRRLVGAIALVLLAVIILPMVFDPEPKPVNPPVSVRIPGEDEAPFKPKAVTPKKPEKKTEVAAVEYVVPVGAFAYPDGVVARKTVSTPCPAASRFASRKGRPSTAADDHRARATRICSACPARRAARTVPTRPPDDADADRRAAFPD